MDELQRIRRTIREQKYRISSHANDEMADDFLMAADIEHIILTGKIVQRFTYDKRGTRYAILGDTTDNRQAYAICRLLLSGVLLVVTAYAAQE